MKHLHLLDRVIGSEWPSLATEAQQRELEAVPYDERVAAKSTYEAIALGAAHDPQAPAIQFLPNADPAETPVTVSYAQFLGRVTQTANALASLGAGPNDVVSLLLPLVPQAFFTLFGAEAAGIANPVNPLLSAAQLREILRAAGTKVLVALGPVPGSDIWDKVQAIRGELPDLKAIVLVKAGAAEGQGVLDFDTFV